MRGLPRLIFAAACLVGLPAVASAQDMCAALDRIAAAAREPAPFASLAGQTSLIPGFEGRCSVHTGATPSIGCHRNLAPASLEEARVARAVRDCLGAEPVPGPNPWSRGEFRIGDLTIFVESHCDGRCRAGRIASFFATVRRRGDGAPPAPSAPGKVGTGKRPVSG